MLRDKVLDLSQKLYSTTINFKVYNLSVSINSETNLHTRWHGAVFSRDWFTLCGQNSQRNKPISPAITSGDVFSIHTRSYGLVRRGLTPTEKSYLDNIRVSSRRHALSVYLINKTRCRVSGAVFTDMKKIMRWNVKTEDEWMI